MSLRLSTPVVAAIATFAVLMPLYLATAAPDLTFWDAPEFMTAAHTLGIPHPPGTPLWVLMGKISSVLFSNGGPARAVTMLSVFATAIACAMASAMVARWVGARAAVAAAVGAGAMSTVWSNATETEVYAVALLLSVSMLVAGDYAGRDNVLDAPRVRARRLIAFLAALSIPLHLSALVALPGAVALAWNGQRPKRSEFAAWIAMLALGLTAIGALPLMAMQSPLLNEGNPVTFRALYDVLTRAQYDVAGMWPRSAPLWLQLGNVFEWADWQVALGLHSGVGPSWIRTPITIVWGWFAVVGMRALVKRDKRCGRAMIVLLVCGTVGVALWLNLKLGPSYGVGFIDAAASHEARERDYFFVIGFWTWGLMAGIGIWNLSSVLGNRFVGAAGNIIRSAALALAALPVVANAAAMDRSTEPLASLPRTFARLLLDAVPQGGVLIVAGDNDTFPLWYLQRVEQYRDDVAVVTLPLLGTNWHREELGRRHHILADSVVAKWVGLTGTLASISNRSAALRRATRVSVFVSAEDRRRVDPAVAWALEGLVYAPSHSGVAGETLLNLPALVRTQSEVPLSILTPLRRAPDRAAETMQDLLRCTTIRALSDSLLASTCNGS